jgi:hypothetical protein
MNIGGRLDVEDVSLDSEQEVQAAAVVGVHSDTKRRRKAPAGPVGGGACGFGQPVASLMPRPIIIGSSQAL